MMENALNKCNATETGACCCVDVGTIIDNTDCVSTYEEIFASEADALAALAILTKRAQVSASEPCKTESQLIPVEQGVKLVANFVFCCQAENMIFQLASR